MDTVITENAHVSSFPPATGNFDGRIIAVQKEISAIKNGLLTAQKQALAKSGKSLIGAASSHMPPVTPNSLPMIESNNAQHRPVVLGLLAEGHIQARGDGFLCLESAENDDTGAELKKRKRAKAVTNDQEAVDTMTSGVEGTVGPSLGVGVDNVIEIHDNPMYDEPIVMAGPEVQACREF
jgi:hypothetical protein